MTDLRHARAHLERPAATTAQTAWDENVAIRDIDAAIGEVRQAALDDGKNPGAVPPVDLRLDWAGRLRRTLELLESARRDCAQPEDNPNAQPFQQRSLQHIDQAMGFVRQGIAANVPVAHPVAPVVMVQPAQPPPVVVVQPAQPPPVVVVAPPAGRHPAYLHALEDLRHARAHLERPAMVTGRTMWDEAVAVREIDAAIHEIKQASVDDGKNVGDHPPVDARMDWRGRLHRSVELLRKARQDCMQEEDNAFAQGLQRRAVQHIDGALAFVQQGIRANHF